MAQFEVRVENVQEGKVWYVYLDTQQEADGFVNAINDNTDDFVAGIVE